VNDLDEEALGRAAARGGVWGVAAETSSRAAQSIVFFVLAGFLTPAQFGMAAVAFVCVQVTSSLTYAGLGAAVQVLGPDERRDRTAVGMALAMGGTGAVLLALLAGPICDAFGVPAATGLVRLVGLALPLAQTSEVVSALLARDLRFDITGKAVIVGSVVSAAAGLGLAAAGAGAGALVAQGVVQPGVRLLVLLVARPAYLRVALHPDQVRRIWRIGRELLLGNVFETAATNVDNVVVGSVAGAAALGAYGFAYNLTALPLFVVALAVSRVALPVYARLHDRPEAVGPAFLKAVELTAWLTALPLGFLAVAGPEVLHVLFGTKWDLVADALRLLALHGWLRAVETASGSVLIAVGQPGLTRRVQQWQLVVAAALLVPLVHLGGTFGAAAAVTTAVALGTSYSLVQSTRRTGAGRGRLLLRMAEAAVGGCAGGAVGLLVLDRLTGLPALALALLAATAVWTGAFTLFRRPTVRRAVRLLRAGAPRPR
jgi:O-antigen/teichoic acid export membrane protein